MHAAASLAMGSPMCACMSTVKPRICIATAMSHMFDSCSSLLLLAMSPSLVQHLKSGNAKRADLCSKPQGAAQILLDGLSSPQITVHVHPSLLHRTLLLWLGRKRSRCIARGEISESVHGCQAAVSIMQDEQCGMCQRQGADLLCPPVAAVALSCRATLGLSPGSAAVCLWLTDFQVADYCSSEIGQLPCSAGGTRQVRAHAWRCQAAVCAL